MIKKLFKSSLVLSLFFLTPFLFSCVTDGSLSNLELEVKYLRDDVDILKKASMETRAESGATIYTLEEEIRTLRGKYEEKEYQFEMSIEDIRILKEVLNRNLGEMENRLYAMEKRLTEIEKTLGLSTPSDTGTTYSDPSITGDTTTGKPKIYVDDEVVITDVGDEELYKTAYKKFQAKDYSGAVESFRAFINLYPNSSLSDNAQFWIAESYYSMGDYERAILEYDSVVKKYPDADKVPAALLKEGYSFAEIGEVDSARIIFNELISKYPDEPQAELAKKKLESL